MNKLKFFLFFYFFLQAYTQAATDEFLKKPLWTQSGTDNFGRTVYLDLHSMKRTSKDIVVFNVLFNLIDKDKHGHMSWRIDAMGHCKQNKTKTLKETHYDIPVALKKIGFPSSGFVETEESYLGPKSNILLNDSPWVNVTAKDTWGYLLQNVCFYTEE